MAAITDNNPSGVGAPDGNTNSNRNNRLWADTIRRALIQSDGSRIRVLAEALITKASDGDVTALKEIGDRLDGKPSQMIEGAGADGEHLTKVIVEFIKANGD